MLLQFMGTIPTTTTTTMTQFPVSGMTFVVGDSYAARLASILPSHS